MQYFFIYYCIIYRRNSLSVHITFYIDFIQVCICFKSKGDIFSDLLINKGKTPLKELSNKIKKIIVSAV